jgi:hypothetical protein
MTDAVKERLATIHADTKSSAALFRNPVVSAQMNTTGMVGRATERVRVFTAEHKSHLTCRQKGAKVTDPFLKAEYTDRYAENTRLLMQKIEHWATDLAQSVSRAHDILIDTRMRNRTHRPEGVLPPTCDASERYYYRRNLRRGNKIAIRWNRENQLQIHGYMTYDPLTGTEIEPFRKPIPYTEDNVSQLDTPFKSDPTVCESSTVGEQPAAGVPDSIPNSVPVTTPAATPVAKPVATPAANPVTTPAATPAATPVATPASAASATKVSGATKTGSAQVPAGTDPLPKARIKPTKPTPAKVDETYAKIKAYIIKVEHMEAGDAHLVNFPLLTASPVRWTPDAPVTITNFARTKEQNRQFYENMQKRNFTLDECVRHVAEHAEYEMPMPNSAYPNVRWFQNMLGAAAQNKRSRRLFW